MPKPRCKKHDCEKEIVEVKGKNGRILHVVACPQCQAGKAAAPPAPQADKKPPAPPPPPPEPKKKTFWSGW